MDVSYGVPYKSSSRLSVSGLCSESLGGDEAFFIVFGLVVYGLVVYGLVVYGLVVYGLGS